MDTSTSRQPDDNPQQPFQVTGSLPRELSKEEVEKLKKDKNCVPDRKQDKLEKEAQKNWDLFYKRNTTKFFKDRHWTTREFTDLCGNESHQQRRLIALEVGCGVGNFIFPLLNEVENVFFYACDFSPRAVQFVKEREGYDEDRCIAFQNDLTKDDLGDKIPVSSVDICSMIFVLSAIHPDQMVKALKNIHKVLKVGGSVLIRDYGLYDYAMLRFAPGHKLSENFYVRQDGTRAYYFSKEKLSEIFEEAGYLTTSNDYIFRQTVNKKEGLCVPRVFVQGKFTKVEKVELKNDSQTKNSDILKEGDDDTTSPQCKVNGQMQHLKHDGKR